MAFITNCPNGLDTYVYLYCSECGSWNPVKIGGPGKKPVSPSMLLNVLALVFDCLIPFSVPSLLVQYLQTSPISWFKCTCCGHEFCYDSRVYLDNPLNYTIEDARKAGADCERSLTMYA